MIVINDAGDLVAIYLWFVGWGGVIGLLALWRMELLEEWCDWWLERLRARGGGR